MKLKLFTDLIDALGKVAGGLKAIVNLPKAEREKRQDQATFLGFFEGDREV